MELHTSHFQFFASIFLTAIFHSSLPHERPNGFSILSNVSVIYIDNIIRFPLTRRRLGTTGKVKRTRPGKSNK